MITTAKRRIGRRSNDDAGFNTIRNAVILMVSIVIILISDFSSIYVVQGFHPVTVSHKSSHHHLRIALDPHRCSSSQTFAFSESKARTHQTSFRSSSSELSLSINNDGNDATTVSGKTVSMQPNKYDISLLLIDHYDSFTYNLYDMLAQLTLKPPTVVTKDAFDGWDEEQLSHFDGIILSPGPGSPQEQPAFSKQAIRSNPHLPILGVCLGHQLLALEYGAQVKQAPIPIHGQDHWIRTTTTKEDAVGTKSTRYPSIFDQMPPSFRAVRYHSLAAYEIPESIQVTATSADDNVIQGLQHVEFPHYGVQFHPESIGTQHGMDLLNNFCRVVATESSKKQETVQSPVQQATPVTSKDEASSANATFNPKSKFRVYVHEVQSKDKSNNMEEDPKEQMAATVMEPVEAFERFYGDEPRAIWLDSSSASSSGRGTLDIMATPMHEDDIVEHYVNHSERDILTQLEERLFGDRTPSPKNASDQRLYVVHSDFESIQVQVDDLRDMANPNLISKDREEIDPLPFEYRGGYLGFLGYEVRHETQRFLQHNDGDLESEAKLDSTDRKKPVASVPDSVFFLARQSMVYHHPTQTWYLIALVEEDLEVGAAIKWMEATARVLTSNTNEQKPMPKVPEIKVATQDNPQEPLAFVANRSKSKYQQDIADCHEYIRMGESYELCLTNQLEAEVPESLFTWKLYQTLRLRNPAPYSAYFCWNMNNADAERSENASFAICSSSPERFMSVKRIKRHPLGSISLQAEAKPIKGTCARVEPQNGICWSDSERREDERRARSLELSLKNRAENLMIVDLLRNDMSRVCQIGTVHVAKLMSIESFATVHQMVSTIRGTLSESENTLDLLRASFPGGSMTGAPKLRTLELLEVLEENVDRGPYAGSLGYLSVNGCMDMNIIIRSAVVTPNDTGGQKISIGAGGAITALSEMEDEYEEMLLKARAVVESVQTWATDTGSVFQAQKIETKESTATKNE